MEITKQGKIKINTSIYKYPDVAVIQLKISSHCEVNTGCIIENNKTIPFVLLFPLDGGKFTEIIFPEYEGWHALMAGIDKYYLNVVFVKIEEG
jgi:hypothetical protein